MLHIDQFTVISGISLPVFPGTRVPVFLFSLFYHKARVVSCVFNSMQINKKYASHVELETIVEHFKRDPKLCTNQRRLNAVLWCPTLSSFGRNGCWPVRGLQTPRPFLITNIFSPCCSPNDYSRAAGALSKIVCMPFSFCFSASFFLAF